MKEKPLILYVGTESLSLIRQDFPDLFDKADVIVVEQAKEQGIDINNLASPEPIKITALPNLSQPFIPKPKGHRGQMIPRRNKKKKR